MVAKFAGIQNTLDLLHRAGITGLQNPPGYYGLALTLGGGEVTPLDLTTAYNTLASAGTHYEPMAILQDYRQPWQCARVPAQAHTQRALTLIMLRSSRI